MLPKTTQSPVKNSFPQKRSPAKKNNLSRERERDRIRYHVRLCPWNGKRSPLKVGNTRLFIFGLTHWHSAKASIFIHDFNSLFFLFVDQEFDYFFSFSFRASSFHKSSRRNWLCSGDSVFLVEADSFPLKEPARFYHFFLTHPQKRREISVNFCKKSLRLSFC